MSVAQALGVSSYRELLSAGEARRVVSWGLLARMPMGMMGTRACSTSRATPVFPL